MRSHVVNSLPRTRLHRARGVLLRAILPLTAAAVLVAALGRAQAVPVFARRYGTSCQTCHVAYPKLTPFGEAFRRNGHRFPDADEEQDSTKQPPVPMGQEAHKRVFPKAVWPGELPGAAPFAATLGSSIAFEPGAEAKVRFAGLGANVGLNVAASLGDTFSAWAGVAVSGAARPTGGEEMNVSIERAFVTIAPFDRPVAVLRVGRIEPSALGLSMHRTLGLPPWIAASATGDNAFLLEPTQLGLEAGGVVAAGRLAWSAGLVEGANTLPDTAKDVYGRVAYKLGGLRLDGAEAATEADPWRERSLTVGAFGYRGQATIGDPALAVQTDRFVLAGADASALWGDWNLQLAWVLGRNARPSLQTPNVGLSSAQAFAQLDWVAYPWLVPTLRYERRALGGPAQSRISGGVYALLHAHVRAQLLAGVEGPDTNLQFAQLTAGLNLAF